MAGESLSTYTYVDNDPIGTIDPGGLSAIKLIKLCAKGYKVIKTVGFKDAVKAARRGEDVLASSHSEAKEIARAASEGKRPIRDPAHKPEEGQQPHYHPTPRNGSHVLYNVAAGMTVSNYAQCEDCTVAKLAGVIDFFNPLALPQDLIDIYNEFDE